MKKFFATLLLLLLTACFGSTPNSRFYLLETSDAVEVVSATRINLAVQNIMVPTYLDRPQIVLQKPDSAELSVAEFDRWASDLNTMLQTVMIDDLQKALPQAVIKPLLYGNTPRYVIKINIEKISGWLGKEAYLTGSWQILTTNGRVVKEQDFRKTAPAGQTYNTYVQAQSKMWGMIAHDIAVQIISIK